jgi:signal transduction histidine kinase
VTPRFRVPAPPQLHPVVALAAAVALPLLAYAFERGVGQAFARTAWTPFCVAVAVAGWAGGAVAGLLSVLLSTALGYRFLVADGQNAAAAGLAALVFANFALVIAVIGVLARAGFRERERATQSLRDSEARAKARAEELETVMSAVPAVVLIARDPEGRDMIASRAAHELLRIPHGDSPSKTSARPPRHYKAYRDGRELAPHQLPTQAAARGVRQNDVELEIRFDDGTVRRIFGNAEPLFDAAGRPRGGIGAFVDVTKLSDAIEARDEFLAIASHELKTPLTSLQLHVESLLRARPGAPIRPEKAQAIQRQVVRITSLVNALLDVSRIQESRLRLRLEPVDLAALAADVAARFAAEAELAGSPIEVEARAPVEGQWDRLRVEQIVTNLISNAVKYGARNPVSVRVSGEGAWARLVVADRGIGIAPEEQQRIFERFERGGASHGYGGLGLGLWIARELARAHGGRISVESTSGEGAAFTVELPLEPDPAVRSVPA